MEFLENQHMKIICKLRPCIHYCWTKWQKKNTTFLSKGFIHTAAPSFCNSVGVRYVHKCCLRLCLDCQAFMGRVRMLVWHLAPGNEGGVRSVLAQARLLFLLAHMLNMKHFFNLNFGLSFVWPKNPNSHIDLTWEESPQKQTLQQKLAHFSCCFTVY